MLSKRWRCAPLVGLALLGLLVGAADASAETPTSQITTPSSTTYIYVASHTTKLKVEGTTNVTKELQIRCYTGAGKTNASYFSLGTTAPTSGHFAIEVKESSFRPEPCQLRAVPGGYEEPLPPGEAGAFDGPLIIASSLLEEEAQFEGGASSLSGGVFLASAGGYALESVLYSSIAHEDRPLFWGVADLAGEVGESTERSQIQVDGLDGYVPAAALQLESLLEEQALAKIGHFTPLGGKPTLTVSDAKFNESTHEMIISEEEPIVRCAPENIYPPTFESCTSWASTGVALLRTWHTSDEDQVAHMSDTWRSTDGAAHVVSARYYNEMYGYGKEGGGYELPGESAFTTTETGESRALPASPATILYQTNLSDPEAGNGQDPQGAVVYDRAPSEPFHVAKGGFQSAFEVPYVWMVPAGGASPTLRMSFIQAFAMSEVRSLSEAIMASYYPSVSIASPADDVTVTSTDPTVTVTGNASDGVGLSSLAVNGGAVSVGSTGTWSTGIALKPGANTITAVATNQAGLTKSAVVLVNYAIPSPARVPTRVPPKATQLGTISAAKGRVSFTLVCSDETSCHIQVALSTLEKLDGKRILALVARAKTHAKKLTVGALTLTIPAGRKVTVSLSLNATGRRLLKRFGKLPAHLTVTLANSRTAVIAQDLVVKKARKRRGL